MLGFLEFDKNAKETELAERSDLEKSHIEQSLANKDINSKVEGNKVHVHKDNVAKAKATLKKLGYTSHSVHSGLNEGSKDDWEPEKEVKKPDTPHDAELKKKSESNRKALEKISTAFAKKKVDEEVDLDEEQLDELKKSTLANYINKASKKSYHAGYISGEGKYKKQADEYASKRLKGIERATSKLAKEEGGKISIGEEAIIEKADDREKLRALLNKHSQLAIDANRRGDDEAVKKHQVHMNKIKDKMAKLVRNEELVGKQHKLDVDKDGKIEGEDLAKLRKIKEEVNSSDDEHFSKQSPKMQDAINRHLRSGKSYKDAVAAAQKHVKEEFEMKTFSQFMEEIEEIQEAGDYGWDVKPGKEKPVSNVRNLARQAIKKQAEKMKKEEVELDEAVSVSHERYVRSHGKSASGKGQWAFTHKRTGDVDYTKDNEFHKATGSFSDAKKSAKMWAKKHGHSIAYVMEEIELDEAIKTFSQFMEEILEIQEAKKDDYWDFKDLKDEPKSTVRRIAGKAYGGAAQKDDDDEDHPVTQKATEKRGRGRPKGSTSGARTAGVAKKSYGGLTFHSLNLPNSNK